MPLIHRRLLLQAAAALGLRPLISARTPESANDQAAASTTKPAPGDLIVKAGDPDRKPLTPDDIPLGAAQTMAWAMDPTDRIVRDGSRLNQILLVKLNVDTLSAETRTRAADGVVAYTSICTHAGCDVEDWLAEGLLSCACHASVFDPKDGARVVDGPAPRALPALPLKVVAGQLVVAGPYTSRVGFEPG
jgi:rieske iron-sulfur protein